MLSPIGNSLTSKLSRSLVILLVINLPLNIFLDPAFHRKIKIKPIKLGLGNDAYERSLSIPPVGVYRVADLLRDLHGDDVVAVDVLVVQPAVGRAHEVLVLDVDEVPRLADGRDVGARDRVLHRAALLRRERRLVLELEPEKKEWLEVS